MLKKFLPLITVECYLLFTVLLFFNGPINWKIENRNLMEIYLVCYHGIILLGYVLGVRFNSTISIDVDSIIIKNYSLIAIISFLISWFVFVPVSVGSIPLFKLLPMALEGLLDPGNAYWRRFSYSYGGNAVAILFVIIFGAVRYIFYSFNILKWNTNNTIRKIIFLFFLLFEVLQGLSIGVNKFIVFELIMCISMLSSTILVNKDSFKLSFTRNRVLCLWTMLLLLFSAWYFPYSTSARTGGQSFNFNPISEQINYEIRKENGTHEAKIEMNIDETNFIDKMIYRCTFYLTNGYKGFDLALSKSFSSTCGLGHSRWMTRVFEERVGINIREKSYSYKNHLLNHWNYDEYWNTTYTDFASDITFLGVVIPLFIVSFSFGYAWKTNIVQRGNTICTAFLSILSIFYFTIPMYNNIGGFPELIGTFYLLLFLLMF